MRWKADLLTGRYPWYRVVWNLFWYLPVQFFRWGFIILVFIHSGWVEASIALDVTE